MTAAADGSPKLAAHPDARETTRRASQLALLVEQRKLAPGDAAELLHAARGSSDEWQRSFDAFLLDQWRARARHAVIACEAAIFRALAPMIEARRSSGELLAEAHEINATRKRVLSEEMVEQAVVVAIRKIARRGRWAA